MMYALNLLNGLTRDLPPGPGQRHNLTINEFGQLELTLMLGDRYQPVLLEEGDFKKALPDLVREIVAGCVARNYSYTNQEVGGLRVDETTRSMV